MSKSTETIVRDVIQRVYGDASQTVLDYAAAREIVAALRDAGWASLQEVGAIIHAAGGDVTVSGREMGRDFRVYRNEHTLDGVRFTSEPA